MPFVFGQPGGASITIGGSGGGGVGPPGPPGQGVPVGGSTGQVLAKIDATNYNTNWVSPGGISDGDKGDITVSAAGATWTVDNSVITFAKMQAVSANVLLGNDATGTVVEEIACTAAGRAILDDATAGDQRTTLGLGTLATQSGTFSGTSSGTNTGDQTSIVGITGTIAQFNTACTDANFQPEDATLTALAALTIAGNSLTIGTAADSFSQVTFAANTFPARASTGSLEAKTITDFGLSLVDDTDATAGRSTLGLGTLATQSGTFSGTSSGTNTGDQNLFGTIVVSGQSDVVADTTSDTLTLAAGANITITTNAGTDTITIAATGGGTPGDGDYGDITVSSSGTVWTIDNDAVTYAKIQNVSATDKILGRVTAGAGDVEEISCTAAGRALLDDATAGDQRTTLGLGTLATQSGTFSGTSSGTNTGDQTSIVGITGTLAQFNTACTDADFLSVASAASTYQPLDATLTAFAGLTIAAESLTIGTGADAFSQTTFAANTFPARASTGSLVAKSITDFGLSLVDDADATAARTTLGLGTLATQSGTFSGTSSGTNTGDQTSIVGITGTIAQFNTACTDADFATGGGTVTGTSSGTNTGDQTTIVGITGTIAQFNTACTDANFQPEDATLTAFAALTIAANSLTIGTGADAFSQTTFAANTFPARASTGSLVAKSITDFGLSLVDDANNTDARTTLGLGTLATQSGTFSGTSSGTNTGDQTTIVGITGTLAQFNTACTDANFQPEDATLTAIAALTIAAESLTIGTGADAFSQTTFAANTFPARASTGSLVAKSITDFGLSLVDDANSAAARVTLALAEFDVAFFYPTVADGTVTLNAKASFAGTINQIRGLKTSSGTCTVAIQINGTNVTGLSALAVTSTPQDATASAANTFAVGDRITVVITSNSSGLNLEASLKYTR